MMLLYRGERFDPNFYYHAGIDIDHCFLLVHGSKKTLLASSLNESLAKSRFRGEVEVFRDPMESLRARLKGRKVRADLSSISARLAARLRRFCDLEDCSEELLAMRARKTGREVKDTAKAVKLTKEILGSLDFRKAGTELGLEKQILRLTIDLGLEPAFDPIVSTGLTTSYPHYRAGNRRLGKLVLVDYGVRWNHYCADLTRCFIIGRDPKLEEEYGRLKGACHSIIDSLPDMKAGKDLARFAEKEMERRGFPKMIHSIGHGVGLEIHESPHLGLRSKEKLAGSLLAIEPAFYYPKKYGMRYEETVWFDGKKARIL